VSRLERYGHRAMVVGWTIVALGSIVVIVLRLA